MKMAIKNKQKYIFERAFRMLLGIIFNALQITDSI